MKTKRILVLLLSLLMLLPLGLTAFAAEGDTTKGTITINGVVEGNSYTIYKIFDLESYTKGDKDTGKDASYSYTISDTNPLYSFIDTMTVPVNGTERDVFKLDKKGETNVYYVSLNTTALGGTPANGDIVTKAIAKKLLNEIKTKGIEPTQQIEKLGTTNVANNNNVTVTEIIPATDPKKYNITFNNLDLGYYLVDTTAGAMIGLTTTDPTGTIDAKNLLPSVDKQVKTHATNTWADATADANSKGIGEIVTFRTAITVQDGAHNYAIHDDMSAGLSFHRITKIYSGNDNPDAAGTNVIFDITKHPGTSVNDANVKDHVTVSGPNDKYDFEVAIDDSFAQKVYDDAHNSTAKNSIIYIEYEAYVTEDAVIYPEGDGFNPNDVYLTYGDNNVEVSHDRTQTYVFDFDIVKTNGTNKLLDGATFKLLRNSEDTETKVALKLVYKSTDSETGMITYRVASQADLSNNVHTVEEFKAGYVRIEGLGASFNENGRPYYLEEVKAPEGYNKIVVPIEIHITGKDTDKRHAEVTNGVYQVDDTTKKGGGLQVINNQGNILPETGGIGTTIFYIVGGIMLVGAAVLLVAKRRMNALKESK